MAKRNVVVVVDAANIGAMIESIGATGMAESIQVLMDEITSGHTALNGVAYAACRCF